MALLSKTEERKTNGEENEHPEDRSEPTTALDERLRKKKSREEAHAHGAKIIKIYQNMMPE